MSAVHAIDTAKFVVAGQALHLELPLAGLPRLQEMLVATEGSLSVDLQVWSARSNPGLLLQVRGELRLTCQRCLQPVVLPLDLDLRYVLVDSVEDALGSDEDMETDIETLAHNKALVVAELVEDEVLLALPFAPRHADCELPVEFTRPASEHPFASLAGLKS